MGQDTHMKPKRQQADDSQQESAVADSGGVSAGSDLPDEVSEFIDALEKERDDALAARQRAMADFLNFQKRAQENESRAGQDGSASVVRSLLPVLDHLDIALDQDQEQLTVDQLMGGVGMARDELHKALAAHGFKRIAPAVGEEFDPSQHEAMMRTPSEDVPPDHIVSVFQAGYALGDTIVRPAKVVIAGSDDEPVAAPSDDIPPIF
jgi:molecular chaperone GrpE